MSRLLFAAARGARIEYRYLIDLDRMCKWKPTHFIAWSDHYTDEYQFRIHPDDAHLAYGPISTALREAAVESVQTAMVYDTVYGGTWGIPMPDWWAFRDCEDELHRSPRVNPVGFYAAAA